MPRARQDGTVMKETLASKCGRNVRIHLDDDGNILEPVYKQKISRIHTAITARHLRTQPPNRVLGHKPPKVKHDIEKKLPVVHRSTLSRLRSGFCVDLPDYQAMIGRIDNDRCPECGIFSLEVNHLFQCAAHPTRLTTLSLWTSPRAVIHFLRSWSCFDHLPPLPPHDPPRPRPPPQPPPSQ